jgi:hypothetical protein
MDTITLFGMAALGGIFSAWRTEAKRQKRKKPLPPCSDNPPLLSAEEKVILLPTSIVAPPPTVEEPIIIEEAIIIRHYGTTQSHVENLLLNLKRMGYLVFLETLETATQRSFNLEASHARQHYTLLVVTQEGIESGWVRQAYELMLKRQDDEANFSVIPVVFNDVFSAPPFLSSDLIRFTPDIYQKSFHQLVSHFSDKPFEDKDLVLPHPTVTAKIALTNETGEFIKTLFSHFEQNSPSPLILLAQQDEIQTSMLEALLTEAKTRYEAEHCLHLALPYTLERAKFFAFLAEQSGLTETVNNGIEFEQALLNRLNQQASPFFLLISRFEHATPSIRQHIAGLVRSLNESHANELFIIVSGGEKLAELKYSQHSASVFNTAAVYRWPALTQAEVYAMRDHFESELVLDEDSADQLLRLSGGHPLLLEKGLHLLQNEPKLQWRDYPEVLSHEPFLWALFSAFSQEQALQVRQWLGEEKIAPSRFLFYYADQRHALLRRLYWQNLLVERPFEGEQYLYWRCEALRLAGKEIY